MLCDRHLRLPKTLKESTKYSYLCAFGMLHSLIVAVEVQLGIVSPSLTRISLRARAIFEFKLRGARVETGATTISSVERQRETAFDQHHVLTQYLYSKVSFARTFSLSHSIDCLSGVYESA